MATLQIRVDDELKANADSLFSGLGLDTSTAVRIFLNAAIENNGIPFKVAHQKNNNDLYKAILDSRNHQNLTGPFQTAEDAIASMLED